jgi:hypothetical protein
MALAYIVQALVVTIVGLNMGFRYVRQIMCAVNIFYGAWCVLLRLILFVFLKRVTRQSNLDLWKKHLLPKKYQASHQASTERQQPIALPHHAPNSGLAKTNKASDREMNCHSSSSPFVSPHFTHE